MLATSLLTRSLAQTPHRDLARAQTNRLIHALQPAPRVGFNGGLGTADADMARDGDDADVESDEDGRRVRTVFAHRVGVNAITVDKFEGR